MATAPNGLSPYEAIKFMDFEEGTNIKCTLCAPRVDQGLEPACVITCPTDARIFGDVEDPNGKLQRLIKDQERLDFVARVQHKTKRVLPRRIMGSSAESRGRE